MVQSAFKKARRESEASQAGSGLNTGLLEALRGKDTVLLASEYYLEKKKRVRNVGDSDEDVFRIESGNYARNGRSVSEERFSDKNVFKIKGIEEYLRLRKFLDQQMDLPEVVVLSKQGRTSFDDFIILGDADKIVGQFRDRYKALHTEDHGVLPLSPRLFQFARAIGVDWYPSGDQLHFQSEPMALKGGQRLIVELTTRKENDLLRVLKGRENSGAPNVVNLIAKPIIHSSRLNADTITISMHASRNTFWQSVPRQASFDVPGMKLLP